jgi:hypothetical protein
LGAECIELPVANATEKCVPLARSKAQDRTIFGVPAMANADLASWQVCYLDAVAVSEAEGTLDPARFGIGRQRVVMRRKAVHVFTSMKAAI